jgi:hypothetical protein
MFDNEQVDPYTSNSIENFVMSVAKGMYLGPDETGKTFVQRLMSHYCDCFNITYEPKLATYSRRQHFFIWVSRSRRSR